MLFIFSIPVLIRHLWQLKTDAFLHCYLICTLLLWVTSPFFVVKSLVIRCIVKYFADFFPPKIWEKTVLSKFDWFLSGFCFSPLSGFSSSFDTIQAKNRDVDLLTLKGFLGSFIFYESFTLAKFAKWNRRRQQHATVITVLVFATLGDATINRNNTICVALPKVAKASK